MTRLTNRQRQRSSPGSVAAPDRSPDSNAAQLVSDVAVELRAPLNSVRASIELMHDGDIGTITARQRMLLSSVIDQCADLDRMISKLAQVDQDRLEVPRVMRRSVKVSEIRDAVDQVLVNEGIPHSIDVLWDGADNPNLSVFGDPLLMCQTLVHLVTRAVQVTPQGGCVLIRLQSQPTADAVRWSVIDQGPGVRRDEVEIELRQGYDPTSPFGLTACHQIAALHFSSLDFYSRIGNGTEISFETPKSGPRSVVAAWSRWRSSIEPNRQSRQNEFGAVASGQQQLRVDSGPMRLSLGQPAAAPNLEDHLTAGTVTVGATVSRVAADSFDRLLQRQLQMYDLAYRVGTRRWVWALDNGLHDVGPRIKSLVARSAAVISGLRLNWSEPIEIPVDPRQTRLRLSDLLVRESLLESTGTGIVDLDSVRMGTAPIEPSQCTVDRLEEELRRLSGQLQTQTRRMQRQARHLRPRG